MKKKNFHFNKIQELENASNNPLLFWKTLKNSSDELNSNENKKMPQPNEWLNHFETLHSEHHLNKEQNEIIDCLKNYEKIKDDLTELDGIITEEELRKAAKNLKPKKAAYNDKIRNEMIISSIETLSKCFMKVFNNVLTSGKFPESWTEGLITPIHKSGNSLDPNNYRGICVSSCLGKLFCSILNNRLMNFANEKKLIHRTQIGFMPGMRTADHILTLKSLHDKYIKQSNNEKIYACFVDFRKAFDSVWHQGLFYQLIKNNIGGHFYDLIQDLYSSTKCAIKLSENRTPFFPYKKGVRQGCTLSPLLFNIYINDLPKLFEQAQSDPFILPNGTAINSLLYADDLIILSRSKHGLQNCLNQLHEWCSKWLMEVNIKKTKVMIFQKHNSKLPNLHFHIGNKKIDIVKEYTYLGLKLVPNGKFKLAQQQLSEKALHALYKIRKNLDFHKLSPKTATKIFELIITPILLYNSEVWGAYEKNDLNKWDNSDTEKVHLRFCKLYLGVNRKASNIACRSEIGKYPLLITIKKNIINYFKHIYKLDDNSIVKQSLLMSKQLYEIGKESFYANSINMLKPFYDKITNFECDIINYDTKTVVKKMKDKYVEFWRQKMINSSKLSFFCEFKNEYKMEEYLSLIQNPTIRRTFSQYRISNHKLQIERGRYENIPREERICKLCDSGEVENEFHFAVACQNYQHLRDNSNNILKNMFDLKITKETKQKLLQHTMSSDDPVLVNLFSNYLFLCTKEREDSLKSLVTQNNPKTN
ncbi:Hypothetical predicted protein [Paramuricea clavata]|uniref:Uncharacterized protein n=1 Tax=Paramuricea clavata TaxID=317549 RepID=A0A7D9E1C3_PARCT|nr:Hypothetical predicted protein [Paramuricea clavata]